MAQALSREQLVKFVGDVSQQPKWRKVADMCCQYYDGNQLTQDIIQGLEERGQPVIINNLVAPTVDGILGLEAKTRTDWQVMADDKAGELVSELLNEELHEAARISKADRAIGDAFGQSVKSGLGWVEVRREDDPFKYDKVVEHVHRSEVYWDWASRSPDLSDARWVSRKRWIDADVAINAFPKHKSLIEQCINQWQSFDSGDMLELVDDLAGAWHEHQSSPWQLDDYIDIERERVMLQVVYYRVYERQPVITLPGGRVVVYDKTKLPHVIAVAMGRVKPVIRNFSRIREAWFVGPHRLQDLPSRHPHDHFPLVPFWCYREDTTGVPYGPIRRMLSPQDEINFRRSRLTWLLNAKRVIMDADATDMPVSEVLEEVERPDGCIVMNPSRKNRDQFSLRVEQDFNIAAQQFQVMEDATKTIQDVAGIYSAFLGQKGAADSGVAINSLIEQGTTTLAEMFDNYRFSRRLVGELLLAHVIDDLKDETMERVVHAQNPNKNTQTVILNEQVVDDFGYTQVNNDVVNTRQHVALTDIQTSPAYQQQVADRLMNLAQLLPEQLRGLLLDMMLEASNVPHKEEVLKRVREAMGQLSPEDMTQEQQQALQQRQQMEQLLQELELQLAKGKADEQTGKAAKVQAEAQQANAAIEREPEQTRLVSAQADKTQVEAQSVAAQLRQIDTNLALAVETYPAFPG